MIALAPELHMPFMVILAGLVFCLVFEVAGVPEGLRRYGSKSYILLIALVVVVSTFALIFSTTSSLKPVEKSAALALSVLAFGALAIVAERLRNENGDHGELYAFILFSYFSNILICTSQNVALTMTSLIGSLVAQIGILALRKKRRTSAEVALRLSVVSAFLIVLLAMLFILDVALAFSAHAILVMVITLFMIGAAPLQTSFVDVLDGAPSYGASFYAAANFISASSIIIRFVRPDHFPALSLDRMQGVLLVLTTLAVAVPPFMALDQRRVSRLVAYIFNSQSSLVLVLAIVHLSGVVIPNYVYGFMFTHFVLCSLGSFAGLNYWKNTQHAFRTWEDFAGAGREHPVACGAFFFTLASVCGLPFTSGFLLRTELLRLVPSDLRLWVAILLVASIVLSAIPVYRLFAFFFGKTTRHELRKHAPHRQVFLVTLCAFLLLLSGLAPLFILQAVFGN